MNLDSISGMLNDYNCQVFKMLQLDFVLVGMFGTRVELENLAHDNAVVLSNVFILFPADLLGHKYKMLTFGCFDRILINSRPFF